MSISAADELLGRRPDDLVAWITAELGRLLPGRAGRPPGRLPGHQGAHAPPSGPPGHRGPAPGPATACPGLAVAGAWTDTGWPATMEGAVRSGRAAAAAVARPRPPACPLRRSAGPAPALAVSRSLQPTDTEEVA